MTGLRALLGVAMIAIGATIVARMLPFGISHTYSGIILGLAMIGLGAYRLHLIYRYGRVQR
jgi:hypothetical protein